MLIQNYTTVTITTYFEYLRVGHYNAFGRWQHVNLHDHKISPKKVFYRHLANLHKNYYKTTGSSHLTIFQNRTKRRCIKIHKRQINLSKKQSSVVCV